MNRILYHFLLFFVPLLFYGRAYAQEYDQKLLYHENFETKTAETKPNVDWDRVVSGNNKWIINKIYQGRNGIPDFVSQDRTSGGTVSEPNNNYLHLIDEANVQTTGSTNAHFDAQSGSETFTLLGEGFCTLNMDKVTVAFFWCMPKSDPDAYAEVYYNNGGGWRILTSENGRSKLSGSPDGVWMYEKYTNTDMANRQNVQVGIRWYNKRNPKADPRYESGIGIDDIFIVALRKKDKPEVKIKVETGNRACQNGGINVTITHDVPLCDGEYEIQLSNDAGNFNTYSVLRTLTIFANQTVFPYSTGAGIPSNITPGSGYRIRVVRKSGYPPNEIYSEVSTIDITVEVCPNDITTLEPPIADMFDEIDDPNNPGKKIKRISICKGSVIDVPFLSKFVFLNDNEYVCEISDENGKFKADLGENKILNKIPDPNMHPAKPQAGVISGLIPDDVPAGCNYYFRVRSTNPEIIGTTWGPFCIRECDIETNNRKDITICLDEDKDTIIKVPVKIHKWAGPDGNYYPVEELNKKTKFTYEVWKYIVPFSMKQFISVGLIGEEEMNSEANFKVEEYDPVSQQVTLVDTLELKIPKYDGLPGVKLFPPGTFYIRIIATAPNESIDTMGTLVRLIIGVPFKKGPKLTDLQPGKKFCADELLLLYFNVSKRVHIAKQSSYAWYFIGLRGDTVTQEFLDTLTQEVNAHRISPGIITDPGENPWTEAEDGKGTNAGWYLSVGEETDFVVVYVREISGGACWGPASNPVVIPIIRLPSTELEGTTNACAGDTVTYTVKFIPNTYYEWTIKGLDPDNKDGFETFVDKRANNQYRILFNKPGNYLVSNVTINKCGQKFIDVPVLVKMPPKIDSLENVITCRGEMFTVKPVMKIPPPPAGMNYMYTWYDEKNEVVSTGDLPELTRLADRDRTFVLKIIDIDSWPEPNACFAVDTVKVTVPVLDAVVGIAKTICINKDVQLSATGGDTYLWTGDTTISDPNSSNPTVSPKVTTTYSVVISKTFPELNNTVCSELKTIEVAVIREPDIAKKIQFCKGGRVILDAENPGAKYEWYEWADENNKKLISKSRKIVVTKEAKFKVFIINPDTNNKCSYAVDFETFMIESKNEKKLALDCRIESLEITASVESNAFYEWSTGATTKSIIPPKAGVYTVTITSLPDSCRIAEVYTVEMGPACNDFLIQIPNAFSPNVQGMADAGNDIWYIWAKDLESYEMSVYDRWGHMVFYDKRNGQATFETHTERNATGANSYADYGNQGYVIKWDGKFNGQWVNEGAYVYVLNGVTVTKKAVSFVGTVTVVR